jgi:hydrogenase nickel incorporation protein HypB
MSQIPIERKVLNANDAIAATLRERFLEHGIFCLNLISSPGSGKTALLERTLERFAPDTRVAVLTGDLQTDNDARRLARAGFPVKQITTAGACHLDARMVENALVDWNLAELDLLLIENVGNLVCPTSYDLGEHSKVVLMSVTEGEDKPLKYPGIFYKADLMLLTKIDLLPHLQFDDALACDNARQIHPGLEIIRTSATTCAGLDRWLGWIETRMHRPTAA